MNIRKYSLALVKETGTRYNDEIGKGISNSEQLFESFEAIFKMSSLSSEKVTMLAFDTKLNIIGAFDVSTGSIDASIVNPAEILKRALLCNAASLALCHNHPSGETNPSTEDIETSKRINEACKIMGIRLIDHLIIGWSNEKKFVSIKKSTGIF